MFTKNIPKDSHHFSWIVLSCSLFGCCVPVSVRKCCVSPLEIPLYFCLLETENTWQMLQKSLLPPHTKKISFLIADEIQNTETSVRYCACWILAFFSENKRIMTKNLARSLTAGQQRRAWRKRSPMSYSSRCQMERKTENKLKLSFIK